MVSCGSVANASFKANLEAFVSNLQARLAPGFSGIDDSLGSMIEQCCRSEEFSAIYDFVSMVNHIQLYAKAYW